MDNAETGTYMNNTKTMNNDKSGGIKDEVDIIAKEKQTDANSEIYYVMHPSKNGTSIMPDKINKTLILISS